MRKLLRFEHPEQKQEQTEPLRSGNDIKKYIAGITEKINASQKGRKMREMQMTQKTPEARDARTLQKFIDELAATKKTVVEAQAENRYRGPGITKQALERRQVEIQLARESAEDMRTAEHALSELVVYENTFGQLSPNEQMYRHDIEKFLHESKDKLDRLNRLIMMAEADTDVLNTLHEEAKEEDKK